MSATRLARLSGQPFGLNTSTFEPYRKVCKQCRHFTWIPNSFSAVNTEKEGNSIDFSANPGCRTAFRWLSITPGY
jgi:hypothetical protein